MSICHSVKVKKVGEVSEYQSSSPDEVALITSLDEDFDLKLVSNKNDLITFKSFFSIEGLNKQYRILYTLQFSSETARMGQIVVDMETQEVMFVLKGSDQAVIPLL